MRGIVPTWRYVAALLLIPAMLAACTPSAVTPQPAPRAPSASSTTAGEPSRSGATAGRPSRDRKPDVAAPAEERSAAPGLQGVLDATAARHLGKIGVFVKHLETGEQAAVNAEDRFRSASLYKLFVLYSAFERIEAGQLALNDTLTMSKKALATEPYSEWPAETRTEVDCALERMIAVSSNAATAMVIERLGGEGQITAEMHALGFTQTEITEKYAYTSPRDVGLLLERIATKQAVSAKASEEMLKLLSAQQRNDRLPVPLPLDVTVAHKTGELSRLRNDAGIVYAPSGPYLIVALAQAAPSDADARAAVVDLSREVYAHFEPGGLPAYHGLPPRQALEVLRVPDEKGRLAPLSDEWAKTRPVERGGVILATGVKRVKLQDQVVPDLLALQMAAERDGAPFWVSEGYRAPTSADASKVLWSNAGPTCKVEFPPPKAAPKAEAPKATPTPAPPPAISQQWLGTVVVVSDSPGGKPTADYAASPTGRWLLEHAWEYGFIPALAESEEGKALGYEPWRLRWVGRELAERLREIPPGEEYTAGVTSVLRQAQRDLAAQDGAHRAASSR